MKPLNKIAMGIMLAGLSVASHPVFAAHLPGVSFTETPFTFDATAYGGGAFAAKFIDFSYEAEVDQFACGVGGCSFDETGVVFAGTFRTELANPPIPGTGLGTSYNMYAIFSGAGSTTFAAGPAINGVFSSFLIDFYIDPDMDTTPTTFTVGAAGGDESKGVIDPATTLADVKILSGTLTCATCGGFHVFPGLLAGDFDVVFDVTSFDASVWGGAAFAGPTVQGDVNGVNTTIAGVGVGDFIDGRIIGSGNNSFQSVPEPASLSLLGLGLLGMGVALRRQRKS